MGYSDNIWTNLGNFFKTFIETVLSVIQWLFTPLDLSSLVPSWTSTVAPIYLVAGAGLIAALVVSILRG